MRQAAATLERSELRYRRLFEVARDGILILKADTGRILDINPFLIDLLGYSRKECIGKVLWKVGPFRDTALSMASLREMQATSPIRYAELPLKAKNGVAIVVEFVSNNYQEASVDVIQCNIRINVTERGRLVNLLLLSEDKFYMMFNSMNDGLFIIDAHTAEFSEINTAGHTMFGYTRDELIGCDFEMISTGSPPYTRKKVMDLLEKARSGAAQRFEWHCKAKDTHFLWVEISLSCVLFGDRHVGLAMIRDITANKLAEETLRASERQLRQAQTLARMGTDLRDLRTGERKWSDETYRIFGVSRENFDTDPENVLAMIHPDDRHLVLAARRRTAAGISPSPMEYRIIRPDGTVRNIYREWELIRDDAGEPAQLLGIAHDITERRRTEEELRQSQKMEAIGNLTGGMAHDFNNLLGVIIGNLDLAQERIGADAELAELTNEARDAAWRGADLTRRLLAFARRQPLEPARIDANGLITNSVTLLRRLLGEDIEVVLDLGEQIWPVTADPAQLESALANLATNARDAMPHGGHLSIKTSNVGIDADYAAMHHEVIPGDYVKIEVSDTGIGMSPETTAHVFEPFFTTKEPGKGTGLGLSMVFGFLRQSGGHVSIYSEEGLGTTFRLYLPRLYGEAAPAEAPVTNSATRGTGECVLVVEDQIAMRRITVRQVRDLGYRVFEADRAAAALALLQCEPVDLLLTDVVMPGGVDGVDLAQQALDRWPALKIVLTSGFPDARTRHDKAFVERFQLLSKPYSKADLACALREALDGTSP